MATFENPGSSPVMRTVGLTKVYNDLPVVNKVDLTLYPGEIYGFLGPNGAGKTTTIRMIIGLIRPSGGKVELFGKSINTNDPSHRRLIGVVSERTFLPEDMTAIEYLTFFSKYYGVGTNRSNNLLERLGLSPYSHLLARKFSEGMQRKLSVARALLHDPRILILDEPTSGLDPHGIVQVRELLSEQRENGCAILVSSHILSEVERTANRVGIIHHGRLLIEGTLAEVTMELKAEVELEIELQDFIPGLIDKIGQIEGVSKVREHECVLLVSMVDDPDVKVSVSKVVSSAGGVVLGMKTKKISLEEAFVQLTEE